MSIAKLHSGLVPAKRAALLARLVQEWEQQMPGVTEPIIIEEATPLYGDLLHLYVIWSEWVGIAQRERSRIVMEAYELTHPAHSGSLIAVTVAMGLTPAEATNMGIEYAALDTVA